VSKGGQNPPNTSTDRPPAPGGSEGTKVNYGNFTDRARKVMQLANQEAQRFNHEYIGTEHILLGLVQEGSGVAANVLKNMTVDLDTALQRSKDRATQPPFRRVLDKDLIALHSAVSQIFEPAVKAGCFDEVNLYDTNGEKPKLRRKRRDAFVLEIAHQAISATAADVGPFASSS
jgi:hypothetical protein